MRVQTLLYIDCASTAHVAAYTDTDLAEIAASYAFRTPNAHALADENKRTAFVAALTLLRLDVYSTVSGRRCRPHGESGP